MKRTRINKTEKVARILHEWYSGYDFDVCPNGPECGLMGSCRSIAHKIIRIAIQAEGRIGK